MKRSLMLIAVALVLLAAACGNDDDDNGDAVGPVFTDPSVPIEVEEGEQFFIELDSTPSTGFSWELASEVPTGIVSPEGSAYRPSGSDAVGASGRQLFRFVAVAPGQTTLELQYVQPWVQDPQPSGDDVADFTVDVTASS